MGNAGLRDIKNFELKLKRTKEKKRCAKMPLFYYSFNDYIFSTVDSTIKIGMLEISENEYFPSFVVYSIITILKISEKPPRQKPVK